MKLETTYPCCDKPTVFKMVDGRQRQTFERRHWCESDDEIGTLWQVKVDYISSPMEGMLVHTLEWIDLAGQVAELHYGRIRRCRRSLNVTR